MNDNYTKFLKICPDFWDHKNYIKLEASGFMDLHIDILIGGQYVRRISMAHNYKQNGDVIPDPDMEFLINREEKIMVPISFQDSLVYNNIEDEENPVSRARLEKSLQEFTDMWLSNLIVQGHKQVEGK